MFADDQSLVRQKDELQNHISGFDSNCKEYNMEINNEKTNNLTFI